ncbi:alpha/beta fold hydrolase [Nocardia nova]
MKLRAGGVDFHYVEHGTGRPVLVLHGAGVDHREAEACFDPILGDTAGLRRIYPDLPGTGSTTAPDTLRSADDALDALLGFADEVTGGGFLLIGHSAGGYYAQAMAARRADRVAGLALVCPLLPGLRDIPHTASWPGRAISATTISAATSSSEHPKCSTATSVSSPRPPHRPIRPRPGASVSGGS